MLQGCDSAKLDSQILEGPDDNNPFELLFIYQATQEEERLLSQARGPHAGEITLGEEGHECLWHIELLHSVLVLSLLMLLLLSS